MFTRTKMLIGEEGIERLRNARVAIIGVGGVGAYAVEMLVRAGIGEIVIVDSDRVNITNKNRQLIALDSTIDEFKVDVVEARAKDINSQVKVVKFYDYVEESTIEELMARIGKVDYLIDAIDTLSPKLALINFSVKNDIPFVSSMGAGAKYDATKIRIVDISKSFNCPLAYILRKKLRKLGIYKGFPVVFSEELPDKNAIMPCEEKNKKSQVGTISYLPAVFGCVVAQVAIAYFIKNS